MKLSNINFNVDKKKNRYTIEFVLENHHFNAWLLNKNGKLELWFIEHSVFVNNHKHCPLCKSNVHSQCNYLFNDELMREEIFKELMNELKKQPKYRIRALFSEIII